jgi:hypothetical protein
MTHCHPYVASSVTANAYETPIISRRRTFLANPDLAFALYFPLKGRREMADSNRTFNNRGLEWQCSYNPASGAWTAVTSERSDLRICAGSWDDLKEELKSIDLSLSRQDAVAVCEPLPPMGVISNQ